MILGTTCLAGDALDGDAIRRALRSVHLDQVLLRAEEGSRPRDLGDLNVVGVRASWGQRQLALEVARASGTNQLLFDLPPELGLEAACRVLHGFSRSMPGLRLAVVTPAGGELAEPEALGLLLDDLVSLPVSYWHSPARSHMAGQADSDWCDRLGGRLEGAVLDDVADGRGGLPPGTGQLDWPRVLELLRGADLALDVDPLPTGVELLKVALDDLRSRGLS